MLIDHIQQKGRAYRTSLLLRIALSRIFVASAKMTIKSTTIFLLYVASSPLFWEQGGGNAVVSGIASPRDRSPAAVRFGSVAHRDGSRRGASVSLSATAGDGPGPDSALRQKIPPVLPDPSLRHTFKIPAACRPSSSRVPPPPRGPLHAIHVEPFLSPAQASHLLRLATEHGEAVGAWDGASDRHVAYNTVDFPIGWDDLAEDDGFVEGFEALDDDGRGGERPARIEQYLHDIGFHEAAFRRLAASYFPDLAPDDAAGLEYLDLFCVRYETKAAGIEDDAGTMDRLEPHRDGSLLSFNVLLSEPDVDFRGGGTYFAALDATAFEHVGDCSARRPPAVSSGTIRPNCAGDLVMHSGKALHGGSPISSGVRVAIVGFVDVSPHLWDGDALKNACRDWGRLDVARLRDERTSQHGEGSRDPIGRRRMKVAKWLALPKSRRSTLGDIEYAPPSDGRERRRAGKMYQRSARLRIEDQFLSSALPLSD